MGSVAGTTKARQRHPSVQQAWQAMRILRRFTLGQLVTTIKPACSYAHVARYANRLRHCGYVRTLKARHLGQPGECDVLQLVRDSGPAAPIPRHASLAVYDPNTGHTWAAGGVRVHEQAAGPAPRRVAPGTPPTAVQRAVLAQLLKGQPALQALAEGSSTGTLAYVLRCLRMRGLVDEAGALTAAGRAACQAPVRGQQ